MAARLGLPFIDTDEEIEARAGKTVAEIFRDEGEGRFRRLEAEVIAALPGRGPAVVATGGGAVLDPANRSLLKRVGPVFCLTAAPEELWHRLERSGTVRPLLAVPDPRARLRQLLAEREPYYRETGRLIDTTGRTPEEVAADILAIMDGDDDIEDHSC